MSNKKSLSVKTAALLLVLVLLVGLAAGGTIAWLIDASQQVVNTFTYGDINITLTETDTEDGDNNPNTNSYKMIPGSDLLKDPVITVKAGSESAYLFVKLEESGGAAVNGEEKTFDDYLKYSVNETLWAPLEGVDNVYYTIYNAEQATGDVEFPVLSGNKVSVLETVTKEMVNALGEGETATYPKLTITGYAVQMENIADAAAAWNAISNQKVNPDPDPAEVKVEGKDKAALLDAINEAAAGDTVVLTEDTAITGYEADKKLIIDKAIVLDLNGKTLTTECGWGGIDAKGGCSIKNGTIEHTGNTAAIKAFQVESIENVTINVTETTGKTKGGIVVQEGAGCYVGSIKNVTITGATNGIETYRCGDRTDLAIGSMENVTINATNTGMLISAPVGTVKNCSIEGDVIGINAYLYGPYSVTLDLVTSTVTGTTGIYAHDEVGQSNPGSMTLTRDAATVINGVVTEEIEDEAAPRVSIFK